MLSQEIRSRFIQYFKEQGHAVVPSSSVVPHDDPSLLFINAGMNQFKDVFLGKSHRDYNRATSSQKCIRVGGKHNDLDNVGHTSRHLTFFEMLGNFSFGNYFKEQAIQFAWDVSTQVFELDHEKIWITIFQDDDEAFELWKKIVPEKKIVRMGEKDNFWSMGDTGPCGPCSELYFDRGDTYSQATCPQDDPTGERYLEFWNLVFMQFNRDTSGKLNPLPKQSVDTGAGLERVISLKMGVNSVFSTDIFQSLIAQIEQISHKKYQQNDPHLAPAFHVIADHIRSLSFAIADGAQPSNIERGYILRKLLRRAVRYGRMLGMHEPFLAKILPTLLETMGSDYHELIASKSRIADLLTTEEESFIRTLKRGGNILNSIIGKAEQSPLKQITGEEAFKLKDTYGFPVEEILLIAKDTGLQVNLDSYQILEEKAKETSRAAQTVHHQEVSDNVFADYLTKHGSSEFLGYDITDGQGSILGIVSNGKFTETLNKEEEGMIILDRTPFYAEMGGQMGDQGILFHEKAQFIVSNCYSPYPGITLHVGKLKSGTFILGEPVCAQVESTRRQLISNNHTATHLLHWALGQILGEHIRQAGSLVDPHKLRFDFNHHKSLSKEELHQIESLINTKIRENKTVETYELSYEEAQKKTEIRQFFGEKYGSKVRVVDIDTSKELCGGTHTRQLGTIGLFKILKESSIAAGIRRIEAVTGSAAEQLVYAHEALLTQLSELIKTPVPQLNERCLHILEENHQLSQEIKRYKKEELAQRAAILIKTIEKIGAIPCICASISIDPELLTLLAEEITHLTPSFVLILATHSNVKCQLLVKVSADLIQKGILASHLIKEIAPFIDGNGGGKADSAQAGGKKPEGIDAALNQAKKWLSLKN